MELTQDEKDLFVLLTTTENCLKLLTRVNGSSKKYFSIYLDSAVSNFQQAKKHAEQVISVAHLKKVLPKDPNQIEF